MTPVEVYSILSKVFGQLLRWFEAMLISTGTWGFYQIALFFVLVGRFLLGPIFGTAAGVFLGNSASDRARKSGSKSHDGIPGQKRLN